MSDEMIQQVPKQGVNPLWTLGGAVVGGGAAAYGVNKAGYSTSPYKSVEDLINEKEDTFNGKKVNGDAQQKAVDKAKATFESTAAKYDADLKAYQEANKFVVEETPEFKELVQKQTELQTKVNSMEAHAGEVKGTKTVTKTPIKAVKENANSIYKATEELNTLKASNAPKEAIEAAQAKVDKLVERMNNTINKIVRASKFKGTEAEKAVAENALRRELEGYAQLYMHERDKFNAKKPVNAVLNARNAIAEQQKSIEDALNTIKNASGYDLAEASKTPKAFDARIKAINSAQRNKVDVLKGILERYTSASEAKTASTLMERLTWLLTGKEVPNGSDKKALEEFIKNLSETEKNALQGKEVSKETISELLKNAEEKAETIRNAANDVRANQITIGLNEQEIANRQAEVVAKYGKGTYINEAGEVCKDGKVVEKPVEFKSPEFAPKDAKIKAGLPEKIELGTTNVLTTEAKELAEAKKQLEKINSEVEAARGNLKKTAERSADEIAKEFAEKNGSKRDAIIKAFKECEGELKPLTEKKWGNGKVAAAIAGGAAVAGLLGYMIAPKNKA